MQFFKRCLAAPILACVVGFAPIASLASSNIAASVAESPAGQESSNFSPLFIVLSDALGAVKNDDEQMARQQLQQIGSMLAHFNTQSALGKQAQTALQNAQNTPTTAALNELSAALYHLEKEQNPINHSVRRQQFAKKITPAFAKLQNAVNAFLHSQNNEMLAQLRTNYNAFNATWSANERVVRDTSMGHYGSIETAMALIRVAFESQPANTAALQQQTEVLGQTLDDFNAGKKIAFAAGNMTLPEGIALLRGALAAFEQGDTATGQGKLDQFLRAWVAFEGDVSTRDGVLYGQIERQLPTIMATGATSKAQSELKSIIVRLEAINPAAQYTAFDAMLILLREGLEALLIVVALLSALAAAGQKRGKKAVFLGVATGIAASVATAFVLKTALPGLAAASASRELLEGMIGLLAVIVMIGVGAWLHKKSSVQAWNHFIKKHMGQALSTGSKASLFALAFLSVFREGAETILFYVGILPNISTQNFLLGIGMALGILALLAGILLKTSVKLPVPLLFSVLTWLIYALGFKMLGVSVSALQLTGVIERTVLTDMPILAWAGIYPSTQGLAAQGLYVLLVVAVSFWIKKANRQAQ